MKLNQKFLRGGAAVGLATSSGLALAQTAPTTVAELASSVDFAGVALGILAIAGLICTLVVTWKGAMFIVNAVRAARA